MSAQNSQAVTPVNGSAQLSESTRSLDIAGDLRTAKPGAQDASRITAPDAHARRMDRHWAEQKTRAEVISRRLRGRVFRPKRFKKDDGFRKLRKQRLNNLIRVQLEDLAREEKQIERERQRRVREEEERLLREEARVVREMEATARRERTARRREHLWCRIRKRDTARVQSMWEAVEKEMLAMPRRRNSV